MKTLSNIVGTHGRLCFVPLSITIERGTKHDRPWVPTMLSNCRKKFWYENTISIKLQFDNLCVTLMSNIRRITSINSNI